VLLRRSAPRVPTHRDRGSIQPGTWRRIGHLELLACVDPKCDGGHHATVLLINHQQTGRSLNIQ